ncbi:facilitated trehalose transporter Tret1-like [Amyelois transitella]|uniref:facilitated trehalose transporter Tret1-like n=1 Tax=Amyelois transitella TaxID=680683 RepID=UPI0029903E8E|nr:facilitated trehalose transporter Tret1-like [Amyelois transitella]
MSKGHTYVQWMIALIAESTVLTYGLIAGWISPMKSILQSDSSPAGRPLTSMEMTWVASILPLAAISGVPLFVYISDNCGRKIGVFIMAVMEAGCWVIKLSTANVPCLIIARILAGIAAGGSYQLIPVYVKEISQDNIRGMLVSMNTLMQNIGIFVMYAMGAYLDYYTVLWVGLVVSLVSVVASITAPESPPYLVKLGKYEEAEKTLAFLRGLDVNDKVVQNEMDYMKEKDSEVKEQPDVTLVTIFKQKYSRTGLLIIMIIISTQAMNGTYSIFTYASTIMKASGVTLSPELQTLSIPIVMIVGSFVSISCVEKIGRKIILATGFALAAIGLIGIGTVLTVQYQGGSMPGWMPISSIILTVWCYSAGVLPMPYVIMSEMFNFHIRARVSGCICCYAWFITFLQLFIFTPVSNLIGMHNMMFCFSGVNLIGVLIALLIVPETKGKSVDEIEKILANK